MTVAVVCSKLYPAIYPLLASAFGSGCFTTTTNTTITTTAVADFFAAEIYLFLQDERIISTISSFRDSNSEDRIHPTTSSYSSYSYLIYPAAKPPLLLSSGFGFCTKCYVCFNFSCSTYCYGLRFASTASFMLTMTL